MAVVDRHLALSRVEQVGPLSCRPSSVAGVYTKQTFASTINATVATGTQPDYARNLNYNLVLTNSTGSSAMISGGSVIVLGYNARNEPVGETVNLASNALASLQSSVGSVMFQRVETISFSNFSLATASSSASASVSFSIGVGNIIGIPNNVKNANAVFNAWIGTTPQYSSVGIGASSLSSTLSYTVTPGAVGFAGISMSNALATNTPLLFQMAHSR